RSLKAARGDCREFIVRFRVHIIKVAENPKLIVADLGFESRIAAPAFLFRKGAGESVEVPARKYAPPDTVSNLVNIIACRSQAVSKVRRRDRKSTRLNSSHLGI